MTAPVPEVVVTPETETPTTSPQERLAKLLGDRIFGKPNTGEPNPSTSQDSAPAAPSATGSEARTEAPASTAPVTTPSRWDALDDSYVGSVKVDGEEAEVTLAELKRGFSFQSHNTRTAQKFAEEKKAFEREREATLKEAKESRDRYAAMLPEIEKALSQYGNEFAGIDWATLRQTDPQTFAEKRAAYDVFQEQQAVLRMEREAEETRIAEERQQEVRTYLERETALVLERIPEWNDEATRESDLKAIFEFGTKNLGFEPETLLQIQDHRGIQALRYAYLYHQMVQNAESARTKRVASPIKAASPGATEPEVATDPAQAKTRELRSKLSKSGRVEDAAALIGMLRRPRS